MKIIRATDAIEVTHPIFLIFGQPGICKSSLGYSMGEVMTIDYDLGAHRAENRRDTLPIETPDDHREFRTNAAKVLAPYSAVTIDTVGRCLDVMTVIVGRDDPKMQRDGNLTQQGWGKLKTQFRTFMTELRALGKDVLLLAHDKEEKDGDTRIVRPDIVGGSYGEVLKSSDFVGYLYMAGKDRVLDFNPTDRWIGKNPAGWTPFKVPPVEKAHTFLGDLYGRGRAALGHISETSAKVMQDVEGWRTVIAGFKTADDYNAAILPIKELPPIVKAQVAKMLVDCGLSAGFIWDKPAARFTAPPRLEPQAVAGSLL